MPLLKLSGPQFFHFSHCIFHCRNLLQRGSCNIQIFSFYILQFLSRKSLVWTRGGINEFLWHQLFFPFAKDIENSLSFILGLYVPWWTFICLPDVHGIVLRQHALWRSIISFWKKSGSLSSQHPVSFSLFRLLSRSSVPLT